jgi:ribonucleotide monophosphatase NagD (HAD superfamily)
LLGFAGISRYYGIGDNPHSDIKGANNAGQHWTSIFVQTGNIKVKATKI